MAFHPVTGFAVNNGYYSIYPNIGGTFNSVNEAHDQAKNPISFRFGIRSGLSKLIDKITVDITGLADTSGWIDQFVDTDEDSVNTLYTAGDQFIIRGHKIKVAGDDPTVGVYFVPVDDPSKAAKVTRIAENNPSKIIGIAPKTEWVENRIEIRTQYAGSANTTLKTPRVITSSFILEEAKKILTDFLCCSFAFGKTTRYPLRDAIVTPPSVRIRHVGVLLTQNSSHP